MNLLGIWSIYKFELIRAFRTTFQTLASPALSTILYFVVFGSAIGHSIPKIDGIEYGAFIVPGLLMMTILTQSVSNASFGIYFPRYTGASYEILSAPLSFLEITVGYVAGAATKSLIIGCIVLLTASFFVDFDIQHPWWATFFLVMTSLVFSLLGFLIGIWADGFDQLQVVPLLVVTPLSFLGGSFYSIHMLPPFWKTVSLFNPVVYLISGFRWSFYESSDINVWISVGMIGVFLLVCLSILAWIFKTGYRIKN